MTGRVSKNNDFQVIAARGLIINNKNQILVVSEDGNKWHTPGGWIENLEDPMKGCEREVYEEIGMKIVALKIIHISEFISKSEPPYSETIQKFNLYCYCSIAGEQEIDHNWVDHDNGLIKYRKFIENQEWQNGNNLGAPLLLRKINIENLKDLPSCYSKKNNIYEENNSI